MQIDDLVGEWSKRPCVQLSLNSTLTGMKAHGWGTCPAYTALLGDLPFSPAPGAMRTAPSLSDQSQGQGLDSWSARALGSLLELETVEGGAGAGEVDRGGAMPTSTIARERRRVPGCREQERTTRRERGGEASHRGERSLWFRMCFRNWSELVRCITTRQLCGLWRKSPSLPLTRAALCCFLLQATKTPVKTMILGQVLHLCQKRSLLS